MVNVQQPGEYGAVPDEVAKSMLATDVPQGAAPAAQAAPAAKAEAEAPAPIPTWEEKVKEAGLTEAQARGIMRDMMANGYYQRDFSTLGGSVRFTLRSRDGFTRNRLAEARDTIRSNDPRVHTQVEFRTLLAGSLVVYNGTALKFAADPADTAAMYEANAARLAFIDRLADPVLDIMMRRLGEFDRWVYAAMWDGAVTAF